ncbi:hypothetical protein MKI84_08575 [Ancylobacter sp. A5.8]|uniref:hypothetical protein n=1 Tax=Ancylobacter gelatini TaxID=2919920 RepID=UPI001F4DEF4F|nr:hypothetical protein [Ancylobacter gelatini]MCJ8142970.1 hypothetical protein [Ancylobacter gelatini]
MAFPTRKHTLTRSKIEVTIPEDWHVSDTQAAQRYGKGDVPKTQMALIQRVCRFNGETWTAADIAEKITGKDYNELIGELYGDDDDEDEAGNA